MNLDFPLECLFLCKLKKTSFSLRFRVKEVTFAVPIVLKEWLGLYIEERLTYL